MNRSEQHQEIRVIADAVCSNTVTPEQVSTLEQLLAGNPDAQRFYYQYIEMHINMHESVGANLEVVRKRMQVEEVTIRPVGGNNSLQSEAMTRAQPAVIPERIPASTTDNRPNITIIITSLLALFALALVLFFNRTNDDALAEILNGQLYIEGHGHIDASALSVGVYSTQQASQLKLKSGAIVSLAAHSTIKLYNNEEIELRAGSLTLEQPQASKMLISAPNFKLLAEHGSSVTVDLSQSAPEIITGDNNILLAKRWRPTHYWSFDSASDRAVDFAGNATGIPGIGATRTKGIIGNGAFSFDNTIDARINVGSGGGTAPATGSFSVTDGVTIEALIIPQFSGAAKKMRPTVKKFHLGEQDEIFRKDQSDQDHRMLLSFQHDHGKDFLKPEGISGETLSFGLYLVGQGYHELKLPLDGKDGRPTLAALKDGQPHHVVATYNVSTGLKAIYLNGEMLAHYQYPAGSKMLSGGSGMANIGNSPNAEAKDREAYAGVIDEVAFYDFALPPYMISQHYQYSQQGRSYFGLKNNVKNLATELPIALPKKQIVILEPLTGLPEKTTRLQ